MKGKGKLAWLIFVLILLIIPIGSPQAQAASEDGGEGETILVGRISHIAGKVLRYVPEEEDWVATVKDTPFGINDSLFSDKGGRAEIIMPNNTWARIDGDTQIQLIVLRNDVTEIDVASGVARFYNKGSDAVIKARTPFGYVMAPGDTSFDLYVGDDSAEVVALKGTVYFIHSTSETRFEVIAGSSSIIADSREVTAGEAHTDPYWHAWNNKRDTLWAKRMRVKGKSGEYLPPGLHHEAYVLDEQGRWERVYYHGAYYYFWRPVYVGVGWAPFTVGRWIVWYGDHTWIPCEPFGYITHHYGTWIFAGGFWYWAPPVPRIRVCIGPPLLPFPFFWYPGRVAWIHFRGHVGWVPLAPWEPYYCYRRWGPRAVVVRNVNVTNINLNINRYKYFKRAVIIDKKNLYKVHSYRKIRIRRIHDATILRNYRVVPVVNNRVIRNYGNIRQRYNVTNLNEMRKPHRTAIERIHENQLVVKRGAKVSAKTIRENVGNMKWGRVTEGPRIKSLKVKNRMVPVNHVNRPVSGVKLEERELKGRKGLRGESQRRFKREVQKRLRKMPPRPVTKQKVRRENQGLPRSELQKQRRKMPPRPTTTQGVRGEEKKLARKHLREGKERILPRPEQKFQKRPERREKSQDKRLRRWHPGQQEQQMQRGQRGKYWGRDLGSSRDRVRRKKP